MSSTEFTNNAPQCPQMVDSQSLKLVFALSRARDALIEYVSLGLVERGHDAASPAVLGFLGELECGVNYSAEIARRLGVSRQMVGKTVRELCALGLLQIADDPQRRNRKVITFTAGGERLMADARLLLANLDGRFEDALDRGGTSTLIGQLDDIKTIVGAETGSGRP